MSAQIPYEKGKSYDGCRFAGIDKNGKLVWRIEIYRGYKVVDGKRRNEYDRFTFRGSLRAAKRYKATLEAKKEEGTYAAPNRTTLGEFLTRWIASTGRRDVKNRTFENYESMIRNHIVPRIGEIPIQKVTTRDLDDLYEEVLDGVLAPGSVRKLHAILRKGLSKARSEGLILHNPAIEATPPPPRRKRPDTFTQEQLDRFLETARTFQNKQGVKVFERWYSLLYTLAYTGIRLSEALGLKWEDVDLKSGIVYVTQTFDERDGDEIEWGDGKTASAIRPVRIDADHMAVLRRHKKQQEWLKRMEGERYEDMNLVFTSLSGFPPGGSNLRNRVMYPLCKAAGVPRLKIHELRHTHATLLLKAGVHPKIVQERLGHSSIKVTMDLYSHVMPDIQEEALARYAAMRDRRKEA